MSGKDHFVWLEESRTVLSEIRNFVDAGQAPVELIGFLFLCTKKPNDEELAVPHLDV